MSSVLERMRTHGRCGAETCCAYAIMVLVSRSGTPSAMTATTRMVGSASASIVESNALRKVTAEDEIGGQHCSQASQLKLLPPVSSPPLQLYCIFTEL